MLSLSIVLIVSMYFIGVGGLRVLPLLINGMELLQSSYWELASLTKFINLFLMLATFTK